MKNNKLRMCNIPYTDIFLHMKIANDRSWSITSEKTKIEHIIHFGFISEQRSTGKLFSFIIGPLTFGFCKYKEESDI